MTTEGQKVFDLTKINEQSHTEKVQKYIDDECNKVKLFEIKLDLLVTPDAKEIQLEKNFACLKCKNIPIAPVQQCQSCDALYCDFCNTQIMNEKPEPVVEEKKEEEKPEVKPECE